ncbi:hypothetical protein D3C86_2172700 [compost metagenome]
MHALAENMPDTASKFGIRATVAVSYRSTVGPRNYFVGCTAVTPRDSAQRFFSQEVDELQLVILSATAYAT